MRKTTELKEHWIRGSGRLLAYLHARPAAELEEMAQALREEIADFSAAAPLALDAPGCGRRLGHLRRTTELLQQVEAQRALNLRKEGGNNQE